MRLALMFGALVALRALGPAPGASPDLFAFLRPWIDISAQDVERLDRGDVMVRMLPAEHDEIGVVAATPVDVPADVFVERLRAVEHFYQSRFVHALQRFSDPPRIEDVSGLRLEARDLASLPRCDAERCGVKLTPAEIASLQNVIRTAPAHWQEAVQQPFRQMVLERVRQYRSGGFAGLPDYVQRGIMVSPYRVFAILRQHSPYLVDDALELSNVLDRPWSARPSDVESILYWSVVQYDGKPVVSVTDVSIMRTREDTAPTPSVLVISRQVFATHYMNGALAVTAFVPRPTGPGGYLVYVNRTALDMLGGVFGPLKRAIIESRITAEGAQALRVTRRRLEAVSLTSTER